MKIKNIVKNVIVKKTVNEFVLNEKEMRAILCLLGESNLNGMKVLVKTSKHRKNANIDEMANLLYDIYDKGSDAEPFRKDTSF